MACFPSRAIRPLLLLAAVVTIVAGEWRFPLRRQTQQEPDRLSGNLVLGGASMIVVAAVEGPLVSRLARRAERNRSGLAQSLRLPKLARDLIAVLAMDYTIYVWHVLTHKVPLLWRLHLVHHIDLDLDSSTALRFHAVDMLVSVPWRAGQVALLGVSERALGWWQTFFFLSVLFHHSNLRLPVGIEALLSRFLTTPRMHGTHHTATHSQTDSNWSSGFSLWDHLHGTFRRDPDRDAAEIGVPAYRDAAETKIVPSLRMPAGPQRDAWQPAPRHPRRTA